MRATGHTHSCRPAARRRTRSCAAARAMVVRAPRARATCEGRSSSSLVGNARPSAVSGQCPARCREHHVHGTCTPSQYVGAPRLRDVAVAMSGSA
jgi:hypothetical protein